MNGIIVIFVIVFFVAILVALLKKIEFPYLKKKYFLTNAEREFFKILEEAIEDEYYIFPQVHLSNILFVKNSRGYYKYLNKINRKSVDFVILEKNSVSPLLAIELDDSSHDLEERKKRDNFVEKVLEGTGIPLLRIRARKSYGASRNQNVQELKILIQNTVSTNIKNKG